MSYTRGEVTVGEHSATLRYLTDKAVLLREGAVVATRTVRRPSGTQRVMLTFDGMAGFIEYLEVPGWRSVHLGLAEPREAPARKVESILVDLRAAGGQSRGTRRLGRLHRPHRGRVLTADRRRCSSRQFRFAGGAGSIGAIPISPMGAMGSPPRRGHCAGEGRRHRSQRPQLQQRRAQARGDDAVVVVQARVGVPEVGEGARDAGYGQGFEVGAGA
ncbi:hypothetical protein EV641_10684 [Rhodococcus sp. SMB37]|nr:hypothetical protein EV641_10684 [Rhodococcus sp. SMB37]